MPARKKRLVTLLPLPPVPPARAALRTSLPSPPLLEPMLRVGKERVIFSPQHDDHPAFLSALIEPDS